LLLRPDPDSERPGAKVNLRDGDGRTPHHIAVSQYRDSDVITKLLLDVHADLTIKHGNGQTLLHLAVENGALPVVKLLLESSADVETINAENETSLLFNTKKSVKMPETLLEAGANPNTRSRDGEPALHVAIRGGPELTMVRPLLMFRAKAATKNVNGETGLHLAIMMCDCMELVSLLLENAANIEARDRKGRTPLHLSVRLCHPIQTMKLVLECGANIHTADHDGCTLLHLAAEANASIETLELLLRDSNANINAVTNDGLTPLHKAIQAGSPPASLALLLDRGAEVNARTSAGYTPVHVFCSSECAALGEERVEEIFRLLKQAGADLQCTNTAGENLLTSAVSSHRMGIAQFLANHSVGATRRTVACGDKEEEERPYWMGPE
jgi:ankyrin repeat protein